MNALERLKAKQKEYEALLRADGETAIKDLLKGWFSEHPDTYGVKWAQYTPYFNDGDPCEFGVRGVYAFSSKEEFDAEDMLEEGEGIYGEGTLESILESADDVLRAAFGDHAVVSATREAVTVEEYDHE